MEIVLAKPGDIDKIMSLFLIVKEDMKRRGIEQWIDSEPEKSDFAKAVKDHEAFVAKYEGSIVGCVILNKENEEGYSKVAWKIKDKNPLIVHRFAILQEMQGKGVAKDIMLFAEKYAKEHNSKSIRLTTYSKNVPSNTFYQKAGYKIVDAVYFPEYKPGKYFCYEKEVAN